MWNIWQDLRYSARLLLKHPGFTLTAISVLALGIGVNAGIFGIINGLMFRPLVGASAPGELVGVYNHDRTTVRGYRSFSYGAFDDIRTAGGPFAHLAAHSVALAGITEDGATRQAMVDVVSADYFAVMGVAPVHGRDFTREEERPGSPLRSTIVSYSYWKRHGFERDILEQTVRINGEDYGIVGVAPEGFSGTTAVIAMEFFVPLAAHDAIESDFDTRDSFPLSDRRNNSLLLLGRLKPALTRAQADEQLKVISAAHERAYPEENKDRELVARTLSRLSISSSPQDDSQLWVPMAMLQGLAAAVLLTSCLNLANMLLAFGSVRQKEIAIRLAVGGGRGRIVRQLLVQGLLLSLIGGTLGMLLASSAAQALVSTMSSVLPITISFDVSADSRVVLATLIFSSLATIAFGLWPALRLSKPDLLTSLKDQAGDVSGRIGRISVRGALVTAQLALSLAMLVLSGLFVRGATVSASADPGFSLDPLVVAQIDPRLGGYDTRKTIEVRRALLERLRSTPGIEAASTSTVIPFGDFTNGGAVQREGRRLKNEEPDARGKLVHSLEYVVGADYFRSIGVTMLRGREFTAVEEIGVSGTPPVIIDAALAAKLFPNEDPIGQVLQFGADSRPADAKPMEIVGVAPTMRHDLFAQEPEEHFYLPSGNSDQSRMFVYARAAAPATGDAMVAAVRDQLRAIDAGMPILSVKSFRAQHAASAQVWLLNAAAQLFLTLGLSATFVAVVGLYGVRSYLVARRTREFGVRMAIGASPMDVMRLVLREAAWTTGFGLAIGLGLGVLLGWGFSSIIYQVKPFDPTTLAFATTVLAVASIVASVVPAHRAASVMPMAALRND